METQTESNQEQEEFQKGEMTKLKNENEKLKTQINWLEAKMEDLKTNVNNKDEGLAAAQTENKQLCSTVKEYQLKLKCQDQLLAMKDKLIQLLEKH